MGSLLLEGTSAEKRGRSTTGSAPRDQPCWISPGKSGAYGPQGPREQGRHKDAMPCPGPSNRCHASVSRRIKAGKPGAGTGGSLRPLPQAKP